MTSCSYICLILHYYQCYQIIYHNSLPLIFCCTKIPTDQRIKDKQYRGKDLGCIPTTYQDMMLNFAAPQFVILLKVDRILASG